MALSFYQRRKLPNEQLYSSAQNATQQQPNFSSNTGQSMYVPPKTSAYTVKPKTYAASGYGSQYQSNPTNYVAPKPQPVPQQTATSQAQTGNFMNTYLDRLKSLGQEQSNKYNERAKQNEQLIKDSYGRLETINNQRKTNLQSGFENYKTNTNAAIADEEVAAKQEEDYLRELHGEALRKGAEGNRSSMNRLNDIFAGLGTIDSNAFQNRMINQQSKFAGGQQSILKQMVREVGDVKKALGQFKRDAVMKVQQAEEYLMSKLADIEQTLADGSLAKEQAIRQAYAEAEDAIYAIDQNLTQAEMEAAQMQQQADIDAAKTERQFQIDTVKNQQSYDLELAKEGLKNQSSTQAASQEKQSLLNTVNALLSEDTNPITGQLRLGGSRFTTEGQRAKGLYDQLVGMLSLSNREKLKGSGAISDYESKVLERAATYIRPGMGDEDFRAALMELQMNLGGSPNASMGNVITAPDGQQIMIVD